MVCGFSPLPFRTKGRAKDADDEDDIVDEGLRYYRINIFFKNYEIQGIFDNGISITLFTGPADRLLVFLTVYIAHCLKAIDKEYISI